MGRDDGPAINIGGHLGDREVPAAPLGNAREIGRGWTQRGGNWAIAPALYTMTGATIPDKILSTHTHHLSWDRLPLLRRQG
jgi:hypothetical protein